ncbi:MAG: ATPase [Chloroflexi bacterium]|nr:MAG: ATPase [Chloroflexota bacterium]
MLSQQTAGRQARPADRDPPAWHTISGEAILAELDTTLAGLDQTQAAERLARHGRNELPTQEPPTLFQIILHQFQSPLIYILLAAAAVAVVIGDFKDAIFILVVVFLNAGLGTYQEYRAEQSAAALQSLLQIDATVRRNGVESEVDATELVPGDIVLLESGDRVPADLRLLRTTNLSVDESFLTGESVAVEKRPGLLDDPDAPLGDRVNMAYAGATIMTGRGVAVVVATGAATEIGQIAEVTTASDVTKPPLLIRMERFVRVISFVVLGATAVLAVITLTQGMPLLQVFFLAVALAVSAIPEGLPVALTVALSIAVNRMAQRSVIVRRMAAVEGLGSCTLIGSDKTGTLTVNEQTVRRVVLPCERELEVTGAGYAGEGEVRPADGATFDDEMRTQLAVLVTAAVICNEGSLRREGDQWRHSGDAVDVALLALAYKFGLDPKTLANAVEIDSEIPFESERKYAAKRYRSPDSDHAIVAMKGAVETVLSFCRNGASGQHEESLAGAEQRAEALAASGYRVLAVASGESTDGEDGELTEETLPPMHFLGLVAMIDPLRPEAKEAVDTCRRAGVTVSMITGDHPATALAIARDLGIAESAEDLAVGHTLPQTESGAEPTFVRAVEGVRVFARVTPLQKLQIVEAMQALGHFVAVTGDGVNDAPALRTANIGVAMGSGADIAKDTAEIIVTDDNFASIVEGVREGRYAYDNVRKVIYLLISTGAAEVLLFLLAILLRLPLPLLPVQILWLNLVTNGIQDVALAFEGGEPGAMSRPPRRPAEGIFNRLMVMQTLVSGIWIGLVTFGVWFWLIQAGWDEFTARNLIFLLMVLFQNFHVFNCRSEYVSAFRAPLNRNRVLLVGAPLMLALHLLSINIPFMQEILQAEPVAVNEFLLLLLLASTVLVVMEIFKLIRGGRRPVRPSVPAAV